MSGRRKWISLVVIIVVLGAAYGLSTYFSQREHQREQAAIEEAEALLEQGDVDAAIAQLQELATGAKSTPARLALGKALARAGRTPEAIEVLRELVKGDPESAEGHYQLSYLLFNDFEYEESLQEIEHAVKLEPAKAEYVYFAGQMYDRTQQPQKAIEAFEACLKLEPGQAKHLLPLAGVYHRQGNLDRTFELLEQARAADPDGQFGRLADSLLRDFQTKNKLEYDIRQAERELEFNPDDPGPRKQLAQLYMDLERYQEAELEARKATELAPNDPEAYLLLAKTQEKRGDKQAAVDSMEKCVALAPDNASYLLSLSGFHWQTGQLDEAEREMEKVIQIAPDSEEAAFAKGKLEELRRQKNQLK